MTTTARVCTACHDRPAPQSSYLCQDCADQLHGDLHSAPELAHELRIEAAGLARHTHGPATRTTDTTHRLPVNFAAANTLRDLRKALIAAAIGPRPLRIATGTIPQLAQALIANEHHITAHPTAGDIANRLAHTITKARRIIDNPPERIYIGRCHCTTTDGDHPRLYARAGAPMHRCPNCHHDHDAAEKWDTLQAEIADYGLTRDEIGTLMTSIPRTTLATWITRGQLQQLGTTATGEPTYRYGDILTLDARRREWGSSKRRRPAS